MPQKFERCMLTWQRAKTETRQVPTNKLPFIPFLYRSITHWFSFLTRIFYHNAFNDSFCMKATLALNMI